LYQFFKNPYIVIVLAIILRKYLFYTSKFMR
jgi:hypothetical protein